MHRTGRKITLGLIVIVLGAGVLLKVIPPETDVALNDQHLVSIDGTLVTNPLDLSEVASKSGSFPLSPLSVAPGEGADQGPRYSDWTPESSGNTQAAFFPPLASPTNNGKTGGNPPSTLTPPGTTASDELAQGGNGGGSEVLPPVIASDGSEERPGSGGDGSGGTGSTGNGGNSGSGGASGSGADVPPLAPTGNDTVKPDAPNLPVEPLPTVPPVALDLDDGSIPSGNLPPPLPDSVVDQPNESTPTPPAHSVPDSGSTLGLVTLAAIIFLTRRSISLFQTTRD
jgi:hypothetical protein